MKQLDLFKNEEDIFLKEAEEFLHKMELKTKELEEQEQFFEENQAFEWDKEFPQVLDENGNFEGFDLIIGNPPYIDIKLIENNLKSYYNNHYPEQKNSFDLYSLFIERGFSLLKKNGFITYIVPKPLLYNSKFSPVRKQIFNKNILELKLIDKLVFKKASVENVIFSINNSKQTNKQFVLKNDTKTIISQITTDLKNGKPVIFADIHELKILNKIKKHSKLFNFVDIIRGLELGKKTLKRYLRKTKQREALFSGEAVHKYSFNKEKIYYVNKNELKDYLKNVDTKFINFPRLILRRVANKPIATIINDGTNFINNLNSIYNITIKQPNKLHDRFLLAILNSKVSAFYIQKIFSSDEKLFPYIRIEQIKQLPIKIISEDEQKPFIKLVDKILKLKQKNINFDTTKLENQIDKLVYKIYGLTRKEIKIIENETA